MHVHISIHRALDLDRLCSVPLLGVEFTAVNRLDLHHLTLLAMLSACVVRRGDDGLSLRVETEIRLVHKLIIERRVYSCVVVLDSLGTVVTSLVDLCPVFEQFIENGLLLIVVNVHALALDRAAVGPKRKTVII